MTFEDAYQKLREGTATDEEAAFVARELENVRRISAILDNPSLSDPEIEKAEVETVQRARRAFNRKTLLRTVVIVVCSLLAIAALVCPKSRRSPKRKQLKSPTRDLWSRLAKRPQSSTMSIMRTAICVIRETFFRQYMSTGFNLRIPMTTNTPWKSTQAPAIR